MFIPIMWRSGQFVLRTHREYPPVRHIIANTTLDPMSGTGTTLRVAQKLDRRYLGIEKQTRFVELIRSRLRQSYQDVLFHK